MKLTNGAYKGPLRIGWLCAACWTFWLALCVLATKSCSLGGYIATGIPVLMGKTTTGISEGAGPGPVGFCGGPIKLGFRKREGGGFR